MKTVLKSFEELSKEELYAILRARSEIFIVEQDCVYHDLDNRDQDCLHLYYEDDDGIAAYCRILRPGLAYPDASSIGRVITVKRKTGLGIKIFQEAVHIAQEKYPEHDIRILAQSQAIGFYKKSGFQTLGQEFIHEGLPHTEMIKYKRSR